MEVTTKWILGLTVAGLAVVSCAKKAHAAPRALDVRVFGAKCDGHTDDGAAIERALKLAQSVRGTVRIPADRSCAYGRTLTVQGAKLVGFGPSSVLYALDVAHEAVFLKGTGSQIRALRLTGVVPTQRMAPWEYSRVVPLGARSFTIDGVTIDTSAGAGIMVDQGSRDGVITRNVVRNTLADAIHLTGASRRLRVERNLVENAGDDGIAVVSYQNNGAMVEHVTARENTVRNNAGGRLMSVVGGRFVLYEHNTLDTNKSGAACLYIAQENSYSTFGVLDVMVRLNTLRNCPADSSKGHGAVMLFSDGTMPNERVTIARNIIVQDGAQASLPGLRAFGDVRDSAVIGNLISTQGKALDVSAQGVTVAPYTPALSVGDPGR